MAGAEGIMRAAGCMKPRPKSQMTSTNAVLDARTATVPMPKQPQAPPQPPSVFASTEQRAAETEGSVEIGPCGESGLAFGGSDAIHRSTASSLKPQASSLFGECVGGAEYSCLLTGR